MQKQDEKSVWSDYKIANTVSFGIKCESIEEWCGDEYKLGDKIKSDYDLTALTGKKDGREYILILKQYGRSAQENGMEAVFEDFEITQDMASHNLAVPYMKVLHCLDIEDSRYIMPRMPFTLENLIEARLIAKQPMLSSDEQKRIIFVLFEMSKLNTIQNDTYEQNWVADKDGVLYLIDYELAVAGTYAVREFMKKQFELEPRTWASLYEMDSEERPYTKFLYFNEAVHKKVLENLNTKQGLFAAMMYQGLFLFLRGFVIRNAPVDVEKSCPFLYLAFLEYKTELQS